MTAAEITESPALPMTPDQLLDEVRAGRFPVQGLRASLRQGLDPNTVLDNGNTLLHVAVARNRMLAGLCLINAGADVHSRNDDGDTALDVAFKRERRTLGRVLLWKSVLTSIRQPDYRRSVRQAQAGIPAKRLPDAEGALRVSAMRRNSDAVKALLQVGTNPIAAGPGGVSALHLAGLAGSQECARELLREDRADPCQADDLGRTPADYALEADHIELGKTLLDAENAKLAAIEAAETTAMIEAASAAIEAEPAETSEAEVIPVLQSQGSDSILMNSAAL